MQCLQITKGWKWLSDFANCPSEIAFRSLQLNFSSVRGLNTLLVLLLITRRWPAYHGWDEDDMSAPLTDASILLGHLQTFDWSKMRNSLTGISKWRRCCSKGTISIQNVIRCPLKRFQSSKLWEMRWSWSEKVRWDGGMGLRWHEWDMVSEVSLRLWWRHLADWGSGPTTR